MLPTARLAILERLLQLRLLTVGAYVVATLCALFVFHWPVPWFTLGFICLLLLAYNGLSLLRLRLGQRGVQIPPAEIARQLAVDIIGHALWLFFLGGATNPFTALFLLPLIIAAASLPGRFVWPLTTLTLVCYTVLLAWYQPLPISEASLAQAFFLHTLGMWLAFVAAALIVAVLVAHIGLQLRSSERALAAAREGGLRQQQVVGLAIQAAGAAHRLGTPLSTLTLLVDELLAERAGDAALTADLRLMQQQLQACRAELGRLRADPDTPPPQPADAAMLTVLDDWRLVRPQARVEYAVLGEGTPPQLVLPFALRQALMNLLDNAADASPDWQRLVLDWQGSLVRVRIEDAGPGFDGQVLETQGLGMGVTLAVSALERAGGQLNWLKRAAGGTCAEVRLRAA
ncbi:ATP-binding protein [Chitinimonas sp.]|uniref:ATP-binding protein n=1 Tax=Chitinimonas sp. TaxID=1934313 RepID=UPI002F94B62D